MSDGRPSSQGVCPSLDGSLGIHTVHQTHACGNWDWGRAIPFLKICVTNLQYCVLAVQSNCHSHIRHNILGFRILHQFLVCSDPGHSGPRNERYIWDGGNEQLISNGERFKPAFAERDKKQSMIDLRECGWDLAEYLQRLTANKKLATVLGLIPASSDTVESERRQMKQFWIKYWKKSKNPPVIDLRGISTNWFRNQLCPSTRLFRLYGLCLN